MDMTIQLLARPSNHGCKPVRGSGIYAQTGVLFLAADSSEFATIRNLPINRSFSGCGHVPRV